MTLIVCTQSIKLNVSVYTTAHRKKMQCKIITITVSVEKTAQENKVQYVLVIMTIN